MSTSASVSCCCCIEVLGKHTDYAGGRTLVAAAEKGFCGVALARDDAEVRVIDTSGRLEALFSLCLPPQLRPRHWSNYPMNSWIIGCALSTGSPAGKTSPDFSPFPPLLPGRDVKCQELTPLSSCTARVGGFCG